MSFQDDIKGQNTQLYPVVVIQKDADTHQHIFGNSDSPYIFLSTNNTNINLGIGGIYGNYHCKPILLNVPSIKESIDIESRKFKISNVSLDISNIEYEGKRFSDVLSETSLINTSVAIYFKSNSTNFITPVESPSILSNQLEQVYQGIVRRISHDDTKCKIELEDLTEKKAHKDLPQAIDRNGVVGYLGDGNSIPDKYKNKPIPMVYGEVDRSPVVISESFSKYQADSKDIKEFVTTYSGFDNTLDNGIYLDPLQVDIDGEIHHIVRGGQYTEPVEGDNSIQLLSTTLSGIVVGADDVADGFEEVSLICRKIANPKFSITNPRHNAYVGDDLINTDFLTEGNIDNINAIVDGNQDTNFISLEGLRPLTGDTNLGDSAANNERLLLSLDFDVTPSHDTVDEVGNKIIGLRINQHSLTNYLDDKVLKINHLGQTWGAVGDVTSVSDTYDGTYRIITNPNIPNYTEINEIFGFLPPYGVGGDGAYGTPFDGYDGSTSNIKLHFFAGEGDNLTGNQGMSMPIVLFSGGVTNTFAIQFRIVGSLIYPQGDFFHNPIVEVTGNINEIGLLVENESLKLFKNDFYANVKGRVNTFDDHPDEPADDFIQNPIDIIYDLVRSELGHDAIDEDEYAEAKLAHLDWKFGFTVNKKISSKKLIEDIAKSTKCFPKFKNDGTFGFNTIKDSYDVNDYNAESTHLIKESEVISYSFKKTKPEQIYKKVTVSYNKDYAQDSYLKTALSEDLGADIYYGIEKSSDAHLEFESDYIRDKDTADDLASFLSEQYKNDHLLFNLKLPLQYINLEIGDLVKFEELFQGVKAYGIDYRLCEEVNFQYRYPLFMVTATTKNLDSVSIECMQLHSLDGDISTDWNGVNNSFPDAEPLVIEPYLFAPDVVTAEFVETDDKVETDNCFITHNVYNNSDYFWLRNLNLEGFDFSEYNGGSGEDNIFASGNYVQIKSSTNSFIAKLGSLSDTHTTVGGIYHVQRIELRSLDSPFELTLESMASFLNPDDWIEGDNFQPLEMTRMTEVSAVLGSPVFDDKVRDFTVIKDIDKW